MSTPAVTGTRSVVIGLGLGTPLAGAAMFFLFLFTLPFNVLAVVPAGLWVALLVKAPDRPMRLGALLGAPSAFVLVCGFLYLLLLGVAANTA